MGRQYQVVCCLRNLAYAAAAAAVIFVIRRQWNLIGRKPVSQSEIYEIL